MWWTNLRTDAVGSTVALIATVIAHLCGVLLLSRDLHRSHQVADYANDIIFLPILIDSPQTDDTTLDARQAPAVPNERASLEEFEIHSSDAASAPIAAHIDWHEAAAIAAAAALERKQQQPRSLDAKPRTSIPKPEVYEAGMFDNGPAHKVGTIERLGGADFRTWVTPYCYILSGLGPRGREDVGRCQPSGAKYPKHDAFGELRPKYMQLPEHRE